MKIKFLKKKNRNKAVQRYCVSFLSYRLDTMSNEFV